MNFVIHRKTLLGFSGTVYPKSYEAISASIPDQDTTGKLTRLSIFAFRGIQMRTFHITWLTFFVCFFGWFGLAPLMPIIREDLHLTKSQIGTTIVAAVSMTIFARLLIGRLCDTIGPRLTYTALFLAYGACFGIEITFDGVAALYFVDTFNLSLTTAGLMAGIFGFMNIFARAVGGIVADKVGNRYGMQSGAMRGRSCWKVNTWANLPGL